jgi:predicted RNase H-like HicB family nuclease
VATTRLPLSYYLEQEYPYTVIPDEGSYFIKFPDLPGCMTQVESPAEIAAMAEEIRTLWIEGEYEDGHDIPEPVSTSGYSGKFVVRLPKSLHRELAEGAEREGVSLNAWVNHLLAGQKTAGASRPVSPGPTEVPAPVVSARLARDFFSFLFHELKEKRSATWLSSRDLSRSFDQALLLFSELEGKETVNDIALFRDSLLEPSERDLVHAGNQPD